MSLTISQISGFLTRHNCNPFDCQWSFSLDPLDGYLQLSYLSTLLLLIRIKWALNMLHCIYKVSICLWLAVLGRQVCYTKRYFCHVGGLINFTLTLHIRGNNLVVNI